MCESCILPFLLLFASLFCLAVWCVIKFIRNNRVTINIIPNTPIDSVTDINYILVINPNNSVRIGIKN
jgi:hypothetical protein